MEAMTADGKDNTTACNNFEVLSWSAELQVEFNKAALSLSDSIAPEQRKTALNRLLKVCLITSPLTIVLSQSKHLLKSYRTVYPLDSVKAAFLSFGE